MSGPGARAGKGGGVRVAVIDSGVHALHPHVRGVAGGVAFAPDGRAHDDYLDRLGHGTAVAAVIREKAEEAEIHAVKVFDRALRTETAALVAALDWAGKRQMHLANLSLGVRSPLSEATLRAAVEAAVAAGVLIVAAFRPEEGGLGFPLPRPGVVPVEVDWSCPREAVRVVERADGTWVCRASGYPRPIPGVPPERNLRGVSFAVANVTGLLARALEARPTTQGDFRTLLEDVVSREPSSGI
jgi:hypothetical protein